MLCISIAFNQRIEKSAIAIKTLHKILFEEPNIEALEKKIGMGGIEEVIVQVSTLDKANFATSICFYFFFACKMWVELVCRALQTCRVFYFHFEKKTTNLDHSYDFIPSFVSLLTSLDHF